MTSIRTGDTVRHPAYREPGTVLTIAYDWARRPSMAVVAFRVRGQMQRRDVWVADLTAVEQEAA